MINMIRYMAWFCFLIFLLGSKPALSHEMTPTYPELKNSIYQDVFVAEMHLFNKRQEIEYYEIGVFDIEWNPIPFVTSYKIIKIDYLGHVYFDIFIGRKDVDKAAYVCSISKVKRENYVVRTPINSRICSKFKK